MKQEQKRKKRKITKKKQREEKERREKRTSEKNKHQPQTRGNARANYSHAKNDTVFALAPENGWIENNLARLISGLRESGQELRRVLLLSRCNRPDRSTLAGREITCLRLIIEAPGQLLPRVINNLEEAELSSCHPRYGIALRPSGAPLS